MCVYTYTDKIEILLNHSIRPFNKASGGSFILCAQVDICCVSDFGQLSPSVTYVYNKMLLNENESYLVLVAKQILLVKINIVY